MINSMLVVVLISNKNPVNWSMGKDITLIASVSALAVARIT